MKPGSVSCVAFAQAVSFLGIIKHCYSKRECCFVAAGFEGLCHIKGCCTYLLLTFWLISHVWCWCLALKTGASMPLDLEMFSCY